MREYLEALGDFHAVCDSTDIAYAIGGSLASSLAGEARSSLDADVIALLVPESLPEFVRALDVAFYVFPEMAEAAVRSGRSFNIVHRASLMKIDVFVAGRDPLTSRQIQRRTRVRIPGDTARTLWFLTAEDVVLAKLVWFAKTEESSEKQWRDILGVLKVQGGALDVTYLEDAANACGVAALLTRAREDAGLA